MKKSYIWSGVIFLVVVLVALLILKIMWQKNPEKVNSDLGAIAKAESFVPQSLPIISAQEKLIGSIRSSVKILVYEDYSNIYSADNAEVIKKLVTEFGDKIVVAVRPYATREKTTSIESAMAVECAAIQGKWQEMRDSIFKAVLTNNLSSDGIKADAILIGLDKVNFEECLTSSEKQGIMLQVTADAKQFSVYGAPTIFVNNDLIVGARPYDDYLDETGVKVEGLKSIIEQQLK